MAYQRVLLELVFEADSARQALAAAEEYKAFIWDEAADADLTCPESLRVLPSVDRLPERGEPSAYAPTEWNDSQKEMHTAQHLDDAFHKASCLAGGWYRRAVAIDLRVEGQDEHYMIRPYEVPALDGWRECYTLSASSPR